MNNYFVTPEGDVNSDIQDVLFKTADFLEENPQFTEGRDHDEKMLIYAGVAANTYAELKVKEALKWIAVSEMKNHKISNNTILLFDDGSIRRFAELNHPFAEITHFYNLPELP